MIGTTLILLGIVITVAVIILLEYKDMRNKVLFLGIAALLLFFACTFAYVCFAGNASLSSFEGFVGAGKLYLNWLSGFFNNLGDITTYAIKQNWGGVAVNATG